MKQILQDRKSGQVVVADVPLPQRAAGQILVRVNASVISAGTESALVAATGRSLIQRIADKPDLIKKGFDTLMSRGIGALRNQIEGKYAGCEALGYSCAGTVVESDAAAQGMISGTRVACGGIGYANHAEFVAVPHRLCAIVPDAVDDETATYTTIGAIAMQGVRQSGAILGETMAVIGLGLVGLLSVQLLRAAGCRVIGIDPSASARARGLSCGCSATVDSGQAGEAIMQASRGLGADAVLICAATSTSDPVILAGEIARSRGRIVMVGATGMEIPRELYFRKELSFTLSRSYGPGRYDPTYEETGIDYPVDYVRFTEQRNMQAFLDLATGGAINVQHLTTHRFAFDRASDAYALLATPNPDRVGIILQYAERPVATVTKPAVTAAGGNGIGFIGVGGYAEGVLLPILQKIDGVNLRGVATRQPAHAASAASRFGFAFAASTADEVLADPSTSIVFITTRHDSHAAYAIASLKAGKHVWVEKPLALTQEDLHEIRQAHAEAGTILAVGFNRRFSPLSVKLRQCLPVTGPVMMTYRVNAGHLPPDHWTQDPATGGGRLVGEGCHFLDYLCFITASEPVSVFAAGLNSERRDLPASSNFAVTVTFRNGSVGQLVYAAEGSPHLSKERVEVFAGNVAVILDDFTSLTVHDAKGTRTESLKRQDKGQAAMIAAFIRAIAGRPSPALNTPNFLRSSELTLAAQQSIETGKVLFLP